MELERQRRRQDACAKKLKTLTEAARVLQDETGGPKHRNIHLSRKVAVRPQEASWSSRDSSKVEGLINSARCLLPASQCTMDVNQSPRDGRVRAQGVGHVPDDMLKRNELSDTRHAESTAAHVFTMLKQPWEYHQAKTIR